MDNPWADPWDETSKKATATLEEPIRPKWDPLPTLDIVKAPEPEAEPPSWAPQESVSWTAPTNSTPLPSWGSEDSAWSSADSTLDDLVVPTPDVVLDHESPSPTSEHEDHAEVSAPSTPAISTSDPLPTAATPPLEVTPIPFGTASPSLRTPRDLDDGFGGFESGLDSAADVDGGGWEASPDPYLESEHVGGAVWGSSAWGEQPGSDREEQPDEWEAARKQKEEQDKHVPPEYLNSILATFEQLGDELWKEDAQVETQARRGFDPQDLDPKSCATRIVPDELILPLPVTFSQTFASKRMVESLKLTRHTLLTRKGPLAMYMASKGATSWEASVKAKADSQSDMTPPGWKIVTRSESPAPEQIQKRASTGGLLSFFSRKSTTTESPTRSASPAKSITASLKTETSSPRPSVEITARTSTPASPLGAAFNTQTPTESPVAVAPAVSASTSKGPDFFAPEEPKVEPPPPSTVSRFFSRFTRRSSTHGDSVALSSDDLEFLSDVVPVTHEHVKEDDELKALSSMIRSSPLPTKLPPPLAPPPLGPQPRVPSRTNTTPPMAPLAEDDLFSFFDSAAHPGKPAKPLSSAKQQQPLPSIPLSNPANNPGAAFSAASTTSTSSSSSFPDFFAMAPSPALPPPPIPPKSTGTFMVPIGSRLISKASSSRSSTPSNSFGSIPGLLPPPPPSSQPRSGSTPQNGRAAGSLPSSRSQTPSLIAPPSNPTIDEDDEFADFITSPTPTKPSQPTTTNTSTFGLAAPTIIPIAPANVPNATMQFDDFNDFLDPSPPPPSQSRPAHHPSSSVSSVSHSRSSSTASTGAKSTGSGSSPRVSRAEHQRTLSLLEVAASRNKKWLSPPSPLPEALPPPDAPTKHKTDLLGDSSMSMQQEKAIASLVPPPMTRPSSAFPLPKEAKPVMPVWSFPAPPPANGPPKPQSFAALAPVPVSRTPPPQQRSGMPASTSGWSFPPPPLAGNAMNPAKAPQAFPPPPSAGAPSNGFGGGLRAVSPPRQMVNPLSPSPAPAPSTAKGGLSAQDLAFFEGL